MCQEGAHTAGQRRESRLDEPRATGLVSAPIVCKPKQRQLTILVPNALGPSRCPEPQNSGVSAQLGATPVLRRAAPRRHLWQHCFPCSILAASALLRTHDVYGTELEHG